MQGLEYCNMGFANQVKFQSFVVTINKRESDPSTFKNKSEQTDLRQSLSLP